VPAEREIIALCKRHLEDLPGVRKATIRNPMNRTALPATDVGLTFDTDVRFDADIRRQELYRLFRVFAAGLD
jgi:hypothetical protein